MDAIGCFESDRVVKLMMSTLKAAAQSNNVPYRTAAVRWQKFIHRQLERDRKASRKKQCKPAAAKTA